MSTREPAFAPRGATSGKPSRRAILAGIAAAPALAQSGVDALAAAPDPIFAAIARHRELYHAESAAMVALDEFEETLPSELRRQPRCVVGQVREHHVSVEHTEDGGHIVRSAFGAETGKFYYAGYEDIERWAPKDDTRGAWIDARYDEWRQDAVRLREAREAAGITPYEDALSAARDAQYDAAQQLLKTEPTTIAGVVALIRYCAEEYEETMPDGDDPMTLLTNCAAALEKIGGRSLPT